MLAPEQYFQHFQQLPPLMQKVLVRKEIQAALSDIVRHNGLSDEQRKQTVLLTGDASVGGFPVNQLPAKLLSDAKLDEKTGKHVAAELLGRFFLPLQWHLGSVEKLVIDLGGDLAKYQAEAEKNYPEVYHPELAEKVAESEATDETPEAATEPTILRNIEDRLTTPKGRAEVLLRLTALSQEIEDAAKANKLSEKEGQELMHSLDALSYAVNTQDLNPLETAAIKRRLKNVIAKLKQASS